MNFTYSGPVVEDPGDLLTLNRHKPKFVEVCSCDNAKHADHLGKKCDVVCERDFVSSKAGYNCYDCKRLRAQEKKLERIEAKREYDRKYKKSIFSHRFTKEERKNSPLYQPEDDPRFIIRAVTT